MNDLTTDVPDYAITRTLPSGFTVSTTPVPPYYADIIEDLYPVRKFPTRKVVLLAGDIYDEPYDPPDEEPDHEDLEQYGLWLKWHEVEEYNEDLKKRKLRLKRDLLLSMCVNILDGPIDIDDSEWIERLEAPFVEEGKERSVILNHQGQKRLLFLKYIVITDLESLELILNDAVFKEVNMQGISHALHNFRGEVG